MEDHHIQFVEIVGIDDDLLLPWLDLYETAFPPTERVLVSSQLKLLKHRAPDEAADHHILAVLNEQGSLTGMLQYEVIQNVSAAFLWYFAVQPEHRGKGLGTQMYQELWHRLDLDTSTVLVFEVEMPEEAQSQEQRRLAERRIAFYHRQGARLLRGVHYMQSVGWHQPLTPMHVMVHAHEQIDALTAYDMARAVFQDSISQIGQLALE